MALRVGLGGSSFDTGRPLGRATGDCGRSRRHDYLFGGKATRFAQADLWGPLYGLPLKGDEMQLWFPRERESLFFLAAINGWLRTGADKGDRKSVV